MPLLHRRETMVGPVAFGGRTITLVARTTAIHIGASRGALRIRSEPAHVEVLDEHGRLQVVHIRNVEHTLISVIAVSSVASACALRIVRKALDRKNLTRTRRSSA